MNKPVTYELVNDQGMSVARFRVTPAFEELDVIKVDLSSARELMGVFRSMPSRLFKIEAQYDNLDQAENFEPFHGSLRSTRLVESELNYETVESDNFHKLNKYT